MPALNKVMLIGNVGSDPRVRHTTTSAKAVCSFSLATNEGYGEKQRTEWHNIVCWEKLAETMGTHLSKGMLVYVEGKIQTREWEKDGVKTKSTEIIAYSVTFLSAKTGDKEPPKAASQATPVDDLEDEIPF